MKISLPQKALICASLIASAAIAGTRGEGGENSSEPAPVPQSVTIETDKLVAGRRAGFWMSAATLAAAMNNAEKGEDARTLMFGARVLNNWSKAMPGLFPEGAVNEKSMALPTVWSDREGFDAAAAVYQAKTAELVELAKAGDTETFKTQINELHNTCAACHKKYRKERPRR